MHTRKLLLVDDSAEFSDMLRRRLKNDAPHFDVTIAGGGDECLRLLKDDRYGCILSDFQMPGMDGLELLKKIRSNGDDTPFIFLTGQGNEGLAREAFKGGAYDYFTKEVGFAHYARIINSVEQAINHRLAQRLVRKAELELLDEKNKLDDVLSCIGDAISIQDREYRVLYQNPAHRELAGDHAGEFCYKAYNRNDEVCPDCGIAQCFADGKSHTVQKTGRLEKGDVYVEIHASPLRDSAGQIIGGIESVRDITAIRKAGLENERLFKAVSASHEGIAFTDRADRFVYVNAAHAGIYGYTPEELIGRTWRDITPPDALAETEGFVGKTLYSMDVGEFSGEVLGLRKDGTSAQTEVHATSIWGKDGTYQGHVCIVKDIAERKHLERERSDFYAMVTHDIKSPLTTIIGYSELLAMPGNRVDDDDSKEMLDGIHKSARKVVNLIEDFLTVSKMESGRLVPERSIHDVSGMLAEAWSESEPALRRKLIACRYEAAPGLPPAYVDRRLLLRAVSNLLGNAASYTQAGGEVTLRAGRLAEDGRDCVVISVTDNGPGIPPEEQGRVFEMYYRAKGSAGTKGTGLGLAIVAAAAAAHGGRVELESEPGKGSTFRLVIPVVPE
ncbi:MAG: PAS domain S-box protein [Nitrospirae bacterium]|nr:PAS domain S-box protein [Nitrospirota bacterium]